MEESIILFVIILSTLYIYIKYQKRDVKSVCEVVQPGPTRLDCYPTHIPPVTSKHDSIVPLLTS